MPKVRVAFAQIGISCLDMLCATSVLYVLLPREAAIGFFAFAGVYLLALAAGAVSNVPGGIGVFEFVLLLLMPEVPTDRLLGALIAYRAIYYFAPFAIALVLLGAHEVWIHRAPVVRLGRVVRAFLAVVTPQAIAIAVFLAGAVLLFSGATPGLGNRLTLLRNFVPLSVLELSHLLGSVVGVGLLIIAHGLYRRSIPRGGLRSGCYVPASCCRCSRVSITRKPPFWPWWRSCWLRRARASGVGIVDRAALLGRLDRRLFPGVADGGMAGAVRLPASAI